MSDQTSIFNTEEKNQETPGQHKEQEAQEVQKDNAYADLLKQITNERGEQKYNSIEDALKGLKHAQEYIPKLKQEKSQEEQELEKLRAQVEKLSALEEVVLELTNRKDEPPTRGKNLDEEEIANLVKQTLTREQQVSVQRTNLATVVQSLESAFGSEAEKVFYEKANELGISKDEMNALAAKSPKAVLTMLGVSGEGAHKQPGFTPTRGSINTHNLKPSEKSFVGSSEKKIMLGATTQDILEEAANARSLVDELHSQGLSVDVLTNPKEYFKRFK